MSNLRAVLPSGAVISVNEVVPLAEKLVVFNGRRRRFTEDARDMKAEANGLRICRSAEPQQFPSFGSNNDVLIGNLRNGQVQEIIRQFAEKGYYDFSQLEYQKVKGLEDLELGEAYLPYNSEDNVMLGLLAPCNPFSGVGQQPFGGDVFGQPESCDEVDYDEEGDDEEEC